MSFTASMPEEPSASWMSASTRPGVLRATASTASVRVAAMSTTVWPSSLDQGLDVGGDHRLVLDDQDVGGQFGVDLALRLGDQLLDLGEVGVEDLGRLARA